MAFLETVRCWNEGVIAFQDGRYQDALLSFNSIQDPSARIHFNLACVIRKLGRDRDCIVHLSEAIKKDPHLAGAYFYRSVQYLKTNQYNECLADLDSASKCLRGSSFINYSQLGMNFTLYKFEIEFNRAVCMAKTGDIRTAVHMIIEAGKSTEDEVHSRISVKTIQDLTINKQEGKQGVFPKSLKEFEIPDDCVFQPPRDMVANLAKKQYVAKAKVIARYGDGKIPSIRNSKVITKIGESTKNPDSKPSLSSLAPRTPPLPRRPLPSLPTEMRSSRSVGDITEELRKEEASNGRKFSVNNELTKALNARLNNANINGIPKEQSKTPTRPPRRPPPPVTNKIPPRKSSTPAAVTDFDAPPLPIKSSTIGSSHIASSSSSPKSNTRNIPPPPTYKPPPPPPTFKPPSPPVKRRTNAPPIPPKKRLS